MTPIVDPNMVNLSVLRDRPKDEQFVILTGYIGQQVCKKNKPFKSGAYNNTVTGVIEHPITGNWAFTFEEDESYVECNKCRLVK